MKWEAEDAGAASFKSEARVGDCAGMGRAEVMHMAGKRGNRHVDFKFPITRRNLSGLQGESRSHQATIC
jgi:hypothetical protein